MEKWPRIIRCRVQEILGKLSVKPEFLWLLQAMILAAARAKVVMNRERLLYHLLVARGHGQHKPVQP